MRLILMFIFLSSATKVSATTLADICGVDNVQLENANSIDEIKAGLCQRMSLVENSPEIQLLASQVLDVARAEGPSQFERNEASQTVERTSFHQALNEFSLALNANLPNQFSPAIQDNLAQKITDFTREFPSKESIVKNQDGYIESIISILRETDEAKDSLDCFFNNNDLRVTGFEIAIETEEDVKAASFGPEEDPNNPGKYKKKIVLGADSLNPRTAIGYLAHEMQHSCDTSEFLDSLIPLQTTEDEYNALFDEVENYMGQNFFDQSGNVTETGETVYQLVDFYVEEPSDELAASIQDLTDEAFVNSLKRITELTPTVEDLSSKFNQAKAISELHAFQKEIDVMKKISTYSPSYFCSDYSASAFIRGRAVSYGEVRSEIERQINSCEFIEKTMYLYSELEMFDIQSFFTVESGELELRQDFQQRIAKETNGCN